MQGSILIAGDFEIVNSALEAKPVKDTTTTSCVEIAPYYNVLFGGFFVYVLTFEKRVDIELKMSRGDLKTQSAIQGCFGVGWGGEVCPTPPP
jgi:hypothetical protein